MRKPVLAAALLLSTPAMAEAYACLFNAASSTTASKEDAYVGFQLAKVEKLKEPMHVVFADVDSEEGSATLIGNQGVGEVIVTIGEGQIHFVERTKSGGLIVTTIYTAAAKDHRMPAVMSRHTGVAYIATPSQQTGLCKRITAKELAELRGATE